MKTIVVDDHPLYLDAACSQLKRAFPAAEVQAFTTFDDAVATLNEHGADLVMVDFSMPGMDGAESVRQIVEAANGKPVLVMSGVASPLDITACIEAGARGYLPKSMAGQVFVDAVSVVLHGGTYIPAEFIGALRAAAQAPDEPDAFAQFSRRDRDLLRLIAAGASNKEIAIRLDLQEVTVKSYLTRLFARMGVKNRSQAAVLASRMSLPAES